MSTTSITVTIGKRPASSLWDAFLADATLPTEAELTASGWRTKANLAKAAGMSNKGIELRLENAVRAGTLERCTGRMASGKRGNFYRPL